MTTGNQSAPTANDVVVVELANPTDGPIAVTMHLGGHSRKIATLAVGQSILLVSPPSASWDFAAETPAADPAPSPKPSKAQKKTSSFDPPDDSDMPPDNDEGARGRKMHQ